MRERNRTGARRRTHRFRAEREPGSPRRISVRELIRGQPESVLSKLPQPGSDEHGVTGNTSPRPLRSTVRITVAVAAVILVLGGATATSVALSRSRTPDGPDPAARELPITGITALRPDLLMARAGWSPAEIPGSEHDSGLPFPLPEPGTRPNEGPGNLRDEDSASLLRANPAAGSVRGSLALVENFYVLLHRDPARATRLLAPRLLGSQEEEFTRSWNALRSVRARSVRAGPDGSVVAEITATGERGQRLVLRHAMTVTSHSSAPRIVTVELRAARFGRG